MASRLPEIERIDRACDGWLLDTNVVSATIRDRDLDPRITRFFQQVRDERLRLSVLTIGEMRKGVCLLPFTSRRTALERKLKELEKIWSDRILGIDNAIADKWGELAAIYQQRGTSVPAVDGLIAATACVHNFALVSNDAGFIRMRDHLLVYDPLL
jgi:predicted nucleic acid-binding protein